MVNVIGVADAPVPANSGSPALRCGAEKDARR